LSSVDGIDPRTKTLNDNEAKLAARDAEVAALKAEVAALKGSAENEDTDSDEEFDF